MSTDRNRGGGTSGGGGGGGTTPSVPTTRLIPGGGTTGQALVKLSNSDYAVRWATITSGGTDQTARDAAAAAQTTANAALPISGGTMTGKITLDGAPTADLHAATKKYVDDNAGLADGAVTRVKLAQSTIDFVEAQNPILSKWSGEVDPTTVGFTRIPGQTLASPYVSTDNYWRIQNGTTGNSVKAGIYLENESLDYTKAVVNLDVHIERGGSNNGSTGILLGADTSAGMAWAGDASEGFGMWANRLADGRLFWLFRNNGLGAYLSGVANITAFNGAVLGSDVVANAAMTTPETGSRVLLQVVSAGRFVYFYVNGTHYFTADLPSNWIAEYPNFGPRIAVVGDDGSISKEVRLYGLSIGTPDPLDISPDTLPKEIPPIPATAGDYVIRRASGGLRSWVAPPSAGTPTVVIASSSTAIPSSANGNTYIHTGSSNITYTLPAASGGSAVDNGWQMVVSNQGAGDLTIDGNGSDTVDGFATLVISTNGRSVKLQKVANGAWVTIADTKDETGGGGGGSAPTVVNVSSNTAIPSTANGNTYRVTGSTSRTITLPDPDDVATGFFVRIANGSSGITHSVARQGAGQSIEGGNGPITVAAGEVVTLQKVNSNEWEIITDTTKGGGVGGLNQAQVDARVLALRSLVTSSATPVAGDRFFFSDENQSGDPLRYADVYTLTTALVTDDSILDTAKSSRSTGDRGKFLGVSSTDENDVVLLDAPTGGGGGGTIADNSIAPIKALAGTTSQKKDWRERLASSSIGLVSNALPAPADHNTGDTIIIGRGGSTTVPFREVDAPATEINTTVAGDVIMLLAAGWSRIGNLFSGGIAAAEAKSVADGVKAITDRLSVFEHISFYPRGIPGNEFPEFIALELSRKIVNKTIARIQVDIAGQNIGNLVRDASPTPPATDPAAPFNAAAPEASGGIMNLALTPQARTNLSDRSDVASGSPQWLSGSVRTTFTDGTIGIDIIHFGTNNNAFDEARNPGFNSSVTTIANARAAVTPGPVIIVSNITSFDATQNRFEDSSGDEVVVPNGAIVTLTQAVYDAAVTASSFTPNAAAIFLTR